MDLWTLGVARTAHVTEEPRDDEDEVDEAVDDRADAALRECAIAGRLHPWDWTTAELRMLYGRSAGSGRRLDLPPFDSLSPYQMQRLRAWHATHGSRLPSSTGLRLAAAYVATNDAALSEDGERLRAIARRAGVCPTRVTALSTLFDWHPESVGEALRAAGASRPTYSDVYVAFEAEAELLTRKRIAQRC